MERSSRNEWAARVQRWTDSGLTANEYAAEVGVNARTLAYWKWRLKKGLVEVSGDGGVCESAITDTSRATQRPSRRTGSKVSSLSFVEIPRAAAVPVDSFEVVLACGHRIRVPFDFEAAALSRLLEVLERRV